MHTSPTDNERLSVSQRETRHGWTVESKTAADRILYVYKVVHLSVYAALVISKCIDFFENIFFKFFECTF